MRGWISLSLYPDYTPRFSRESYLYNTDGLIFETYGFSVVFINEHKNRDHLDRDDYHTSKDIPENMDWGDATDLAKVAIETVARLAGVKTSG